MQSSKDDRQLNSKWPDGKRYHERCIDQKPWYPERDNPLNQSKIYRKFDKEDDANICKSSPSGRNGQEWSGMVKRVLLAGRKG